MGYQDANFVKYYLGGISKILCKPRYVTVLVILSLEARPLYYHPGIMCWLAGARERGRDRDGVSII